MRNLFRNGTYILVVTLFIIILFFSAGVSYLKEYNDNIIEKEYYTGKNYIQFEITKDDNVEYNEIINFIVKNSKYNIFNNYITGNNFMLNGVYFNEDLTNKPKLTEGRYFNKEDFSDEGRENLAVVGKGISQEIYLKGNQKYIQYNDEPYKVIGIMGDEESQRMFDYTMIFNLRENLNLNKYLDLSKQWFISCNDKNIDLREELKSLNQKLINEGIKANFIEVANNKQPNPIISTIASTKNITIHYSIFIVAIAMNIFILIANWIKGMELEIGVRKAFGASNLHIYIFIFSKYIKITAVAGILAVIVQYIMVMCKVLNVDLKVSIVNFIGISIFSFLCSAVLITFSIKKLNKIEANTIMKGYM